MRACSAPFRRPPTAAGLGTRSRLLLAGVIGATAGLFVGGMHIFVAINVGLSYFITYLLYIVFVVGEKPADQMKFGMAGIVAYGLLNAFVAVHALGLVIPAAFCITKTVVSCFMLKAAYQIYKEETGAPLL